jgi:NitT/TauT family transport system ATP-binding protein
MNKMHRARAPSLSAARRAAGQGVANREFVALLEPSGCGKSTLFYLIGGFLPIETGSIFIDVAPVGAPSPDRGIVFQHFALFPWKTVRGNVLYGLERTRAQDRDLRDP